MDTFGSLLRYYRNRATDPLNGKPLSQARFAASVNASITTVSYWENNQRHISAQDRPLLLSLLEVLSKHGGIQSLAEANALLAAGGYHALNEDEIRRDFPNWWPKDEQEGSFQQVVEIKPGLETPEPEISPIDPKKETNDKFALRVDTISLSAFTQSNKLLHALGPKTASISHRLIILLLWIYAFCSWLVILNRSNANLTGSLWKGVLWGSANVIIPFILAFVLSENRPAEVERVDVLSHVIWARKVLSTLLGYQLGLFIALLVALTFFYVEPFHSHWNFLQVVAIILLPGIPFSSAYFVRRKHINLLYSAHRENKAPASVLTSLQSWDGILFILYLFLPSLLIGFIYSWPNIYANFLTSILLLLVVMVIFAAIETLHYQRPEYTQPSSYWILLLGFVLSFAHLQFPSNQGLTGIGVLSVFFVAYFPFVWPDVAEDEFRPIVVIVLLFTVYLALTQISASLARVILLSDGAIALIYTLIRLRRRHQHSRLSRTAQTD